MIPHRLKGRLPELLLVGVAILWGSTFLVIRIALTTGCDPLLFVALRFGAAAIAVLAIARGRLRGVTRIEWIAGLAIGVPMTTGYLLQTSGLQSVPSSTSAFLTSLYVPAVPILQWLFLRRPPRLASWIGVALAFAGLVLIAGPQSLAVGFSRGEWLTLASALAFAGEIILVGLFATRVDAARVATIDLVIVTIGALAMMPFTGAHPAMPGPLVLALALGLGLATAAIQVSMNWAQRSVSPTRATLIYASEPVFAGLLGALAGERLGWMAWLGAGLILAGVLASELPSTRASGEG